MIFEEIESTRAKVAEPCGIAGVYLTFYNSEEHRAAFEKSSVRIEYNTSTSTPDVLSWRLSVLLWHTTRRLCRALRLLQDKGLCCDKLTVLVDRVDLDQAVVSMVSIALEDVAAFHVASIELYKHEIYRPNGGLGQLLFEFELAEVAVDPESHRKLSTCWTKARALLNGLFASENRQPSVNLRWHTSFQLHECVLACQILAVPVLSYAQAHTGDFHSHLLKEPIEMLKLHGYAGYEGLEYEKETVELSYKQLACIGDLVGGEVIVFLMLNELPSKPFARVGCNWIEKRARKIYRS